MRLCQGSLWKLPRSVCKRVGGKSAPVRQRNVGNRLHLPRHPCFASTIARTLCVDPSRQLQGLNHYGTHAKHRVEHAQDIIVDDLEATLEAHRITNRASLIRRTATAPDPRYRPVAIEWSEDSANGNTESSVASYSLQPAAEEKQDENQEGTIRREDDISQKAKEDQEGTVRREHGISQKAKDAPKPWDYWPPGSMQYQRLRQSKEKIRSGSILEYHGRMMGPSTQGWKLRLLPTQEWNRPWLDHLRERGGDALERLGNEIKAFELYMKLSSTENLAVHKVATEVQDLVIDTLQDCSCEVIGSHSTGTALPYSDIDFAVSLPKIKIDAARHGKSPNGRQYKKIYREVLSKVREAFETSPDYRQFAVLVPGRIPIVRATHRATGLEVQVQISSGVIPQTQYTLAYLAEYPTLRPLYVVLRSALEIRRLNVPFEGGLGSYALLMMIVNALKHASGQYDPLDLGAQLMMVLDFYGRNDLYRHGFSIEPPCMFRKSSKPVTSDEVTAQFTEEVLAGIDAIVKGDPQKPYLLCLQDPADPKNDLGRKAYAIKHIQATFGKAQRMIKEKMEAWDRRPDDSAKKPATKALLNILLEANYERFDLKRSRLLTFGLKTSGRESDSDGSSIKPLTPPPRQGKVSAQEMLQKVIEIDERKAKEANS
ncbi:MAG: hypothetical protein Q9220_002135 [cf. Caloplaca sp. 1 TL-2023]